MIEREINIYTYVCVYIARSLLGIRSATQPTEVRSLIDIDIDIDI